ncbi:MAG: hydrogenase maturation nickel metallochaperone HypA [Candidatus Moranbacteria bacterium]|nr:hydrogenase maturation nickel metallochaperone HypA [Candidatus Moranbacteria bacterium]
MHDFLLAKEIIDKLREIAQEKKISKITRVNLEIGNISMSHDGHPEHLEEINIENLEFGLGGIVKDDPMFRDVKFGIRKTQSESWGITDIEAE